MSKSAKYFKSLALRGFNPAAPRTKYITASSVSWTKDTITDAQAAALKKQQSTTSPSQ